LKEELDTVVVRCVNVGININTASKSLFMCLELAKNGRKYCGISNRKRPFEDRKQLKKSASISEKVTNKQQHLSELKMEKS
jgi:transcriptional accessory protein Tex/SPT6